MSYIKRSIRLTLYIIFKTDPCCLQRLNLTAANRIFIVELQWNPTVENQAIARAIRINQSDKVIVTRYKMKDTVEQVCEVPSPPKYGRSKIK